MDREWNPQREPMTEGWASQLSPSLPSVHVTPEVQAKQELFWDSSERFHALATASGQIVWTARPDGTAYDASFWRAYTGQSINDVRGLGWLNAIHSEDRERACADWSRAVAMKHTYETECRLRRADGVYRLFLMRGVPLLDAAGNIREWVGVCTDISKRKQLEEALQASEAHFRATFEHASVGIGNATLEGQWFDVNQRFCDMLGYTREEMLTHTFQDITHPDDLQASLEHSQRLLAGLCQSYTLEKRYIRKDGSPLWVNLTVSLVRTPEGTPYHTIGIIEDISERKQLKEALQASEAHFRAIFEHAPVGIGQTNQRGQWLSVNQHFCDMLGYTREELLTRSFQDITHPDDLEASLHLARQLWDGVSPALAMEKRYLRKDGSPLWVNVTISLVRSPEGKFRYTVVIIEDISQRKQLEEDHARLFQAEQQARAEAAARASQLEATIEAMTEGVGIYTPQGDALLTNRSGQNILGINDPERFRLFTSRSHPERIALLRCRDKDGNPYPPERSPLTRALRGEVVTEAQSEDMLITALDGHERYLSATAAPIPNAQGQPAGAVFVYRDVTKRRILERRTHDALSALLEMAKALVAPASGAEDLFDEEAHTGISTVAQRLAEMVARVMGCEHVGIAAVEPETTQLVPLAIISTDSQTHCQWWGRRLDAYHLCDSANPILLERLCAGEVLVVDTSTKLLKTPHLFNRPGTLLAPMHVGKHLVGLLSIGHASAEYVYTPQEIALAGAVAKLTALVIEREHLLRQREEAHASVLAIRETNRQLETFLGMASHELKTPLTSILMGQEMLQRRLQHLRRSLAEAPEDIARQVEALQALTDTTRQQGGRLNRLVNDLLDTSRIQTGRLILSMNSVDLAAIVRSAVEEQRQMAPERLLLLHLPESGSLPVRADAERIRQVVTNYLTNALKYSAEERPVEVGIFRQNQQGHVWVRDQGPGIPEDEQEHLWERFHRVPGIEPLSGSGIGLGIGLYISKTIIDQHGGQVGVLSAPGQGATFWFTLPLEVQAEAPQSEGPFSLGQAAS